MIVLVCGGRDYEDWAAVEAVLRIFDPRKTSLIHGGCPTGADHIANDIANDQGWRSIYIFSADWDKYGRAAGPKRNKQMLVEGNPDIVVAFPGGAGTNNMVVQALKAKVHVLRYEQNFRK